MGRLPIPTGRMAAVTAAVAALVLLAPGDPLRSWAAANLVLLGAFVADWAAGAGPRAVAVQRELPPVVGLDAEAVVGWRVRNSTDRRIEVALADELAPSLRAQTRRVRLVVPAGGEARASTGIRPGRRGHFEPREVVVRIPGPLGLAARQHRHEVPGQLRVHPAFPSRRAADLRVERARLLQAGLRAAAGRGGATEFDHLREYSVDDEARHIDWAATARAGKPIVRSYRPERNQNVLLLLDSGRTMAARVPGAEPTDPQVPRLDHALDAVMAVTSVATRMGDRAGLVAFADEVRAVVAPGHSGDQLRRVIEALSTLEPRLVESDHQRAFAATLQRFHRRSLLVVVTEVEREPVEETLMPALPLVLRDHLVLVAAVRDAGVARWARATPRNAAAAYRKAAAVAALERRSGTVARLRGLGVMVVDEPPGALAPALVDAYLEVKSTGRL